MDKSDSKVRWMVSHFIDELMNLEMEAKLESSWWTSTQEEEETT